MEYVTLNNGVKMPKLGYGVFQVTNEECKRCALDEGKSLFFDHYDPATVEMLTNMGKTRVV